MSEMLPRSLSVDALRKALRNSSVSLLDKLLIASDLCKSNALPVAHRCDILLMWCWHASVEANDKLTTLAYQPFWTLFNDVISLLADRASTSKHLVRQVARNVSPLIQVFIELVKCGSLQPSHSAPNAEIVASASRILNVLQNHLSDLLRPTLDHYFHLNADIANLVLVLGIGKVHGLKDAYLALLASTVRGLYRLVTQNANQKKVFTSTVTTLLLPFVILRFQLLHNNIRPDISSAIDSLLTSSLFHHEHIPEYAMALQQLGRKQTEQKVVSYPKQLFDGLKSMVLRDGEGGKNEGTIAEGSVASLAVLHYLVPLYESFCAGKSSLSKKSPAGLNTPTFSIEFSFFLQLEKLLDEVLASEASIELKKEATVAIWGLLQILNRRGVYVPTNEEISRKMAKCFETMVGKLLLLCKAEENDALKEEIIEAWNQLLALDTASLDPHMSDILGIVIPTNPDSIKASIRLLDSLLQTKTKGHCLDDLVGQLLQITRSLVLKPAHHLLLVDSVVLCIFSTCISQSLPAQVLQILRTILSELEHHAFPSFTHPSSKKPPSLTNSSTRLVHILTLLTSALRSQTLNAPNHRQALATLVNEMGRSVVSPLIRLWCADETSATITKGKKRKAGEVGVEEEEMEARVVPGVLELYLTLGGLSDEYWEECVHGDCGIETVVRRGCRSGSPATILATVKIGLFHLDRLESAGSGASNADGVAETVIETSLRWIEKEMAGGRTVGWNGTVPGVHVHCVGVALFSIVADHFALACRLASASQLQQISRLFVKTLAEEDPATTPVDFETFGSVVNKLLSSSAFFEITPFRSLFWKTYLSILSDAAKGTDTPYLSKTCTALQSQSHQHILSDLAPTLTLLLPEVLSGSLATSTPVKTAVLNLVTWLNVFPTVYFSNADAIAVSLILVSVDFEVVRRKSSTIESVRLLGACRRICSRIWNARDDRTVTLFSPDFVPYYLQTPSFPNPTLRADSDTIITSTLRAILHRSQRPMPRGSTATASSYIDATLTYLSNTVLTPWRKNPSHPPITQLPGFVLVLSGLIEGEEYGARGRCKDIVGECEGLAMAWIEGLLARDTCDPVLVLGMCDLLDLLARTRNPDSESWVEIEPVVKLIRGVGLMLSRFVGLIASAMERDDTGTCEVVCARLCRCVLICAGSCADTSPPEYILSIVWGVATLVPSDVREKYIDAALGGYASSCGPDAYTEVVGTVIKETREFVDEAFVCISSKRVEEKRCSLLKILSVVLINCPPGGKRAVNRQISQVLRLLVLVIHQTGSLEVIHTVVQLMDALCTDRFVFMHSSDLTIIFDVIAALTSPSILARVRLHRQPHLESPLQPLTASESSALFDAIAQLLLSIVRLRKPELVHSIPSLFAVLRTLFACFRTLGDSDNNVMDQTLIRLTSSKSLQFSNEPHNPFRIDPFPLLTARAPLPPQNAETFSRILVAIAQKSAAEGTSGGTTQKIASETTVKPFVKYAPNLIAEYVGLLLLRPSGSNAWWGPPPAAQRASLVEGIYALLDICRPSEREHLLACMDHPAAGGAGGKLVLKNLVQDWNRFHRYAGKV